MYHQQQQDQVKSPVYRANSSHPPPTYADPRVYHPQSSPQSVRPYSQQPQTRHSDTRMQENNSSPQGGAPPLSFQAPTFVAHLDGFRSHIYREEDRIVNMRLLQDRLKKVANQKNMENIYKSAVQTMRDGLIEYMRTCLEELLDAGLSQRYLNQLASRNTTEGTLGEYVCYDQGMVAPTGFKTICMGNPRIDLDNAMAREEEREEQMRLRAEAIALKKAEEERKREEEQALLNKGRRRGRAAAEKITPLQQQPPTEEALPKYSVQDTYMKNSNEALSCFTSTTHKRQLSAPPTQGKKVTPLFIRSGKGLYAPDAFGGQMPERKITVRELRFWLERTQRVMPALRHQIMERLNNLKI
ncbi:hypothetical protein FGO68_gene6931 [Halteria grandinella]|uniref:Uncharacterized protein n=1 Tax=Halteria grandinella TaxID=5974 RepID=A0A8J8T1W0_HALGN|nr:hypothetical protein FGO68_gene6931 [Halteria grandinella]